MSVKLRLPEVEDSEGLGPELRVKKLTGEISVTSRSTSTTFAKRPGLQALSEIFLPSGFPDSVSPDYIRYQVFDSLQAFSSTIAGLLSSRAVLEGFGVGDEKASSTNAVLLTVVQDATGRLATIIFAWRFGPALAPEAKMYRLAADIFNDSAFILDCLSPALPTHFRIMTLCLAGALRAICGVCGGGAKAALSAHFARAGNVGELNAKDASQETVIGLLGMLCGSFVMSHITSRPATWTALFLLLVVHIVTNYFAVRSVSLRTLNRQRTNIAYGRYCSQSDIVPAPSEVARQERIFEIPGAVRDPLLGEMLGKCTVCSSAEELSRSSRKKSTSSWLVALEVFRKESYVLLGPWPGGPCRVLICFKSGARQKDYLKAWVNAFELCQIVSAKRKGVSRGHSSSNSDELTDLRSSLDQVNKRFSDFLEKAKEAGWDLVTDAICTGPVRTVDIEIDDIDVKKNS